MLSSCRLVLGCWCHEARAIIVNTGVGRQYTMITLARRAAQAIAVSANEALRLAVPPALRRD